MQIAILFKALFFNGVGTSSILLALMTLFDFQCGEARFQCLSNALDGDVPNRFYAALGVGVVFLVIGGALGAKEANIIKSIWDGIASKIPSFGRAGE